MKLAVEELKRSRRTEHATHRRVYRPWGYYESIDAGERFQVKRLMIKPGARLSLQLHRKRAEHWVVVSGRGEGDARRRGAAPGPEPVHLHLHRRPSTAWRIPAWIRCS